MADRLCNDESSEDGSTSYSEFCDDDTIRRAITTQPDATQSQESSSPLPSTNTSYSSQDVLLGKRKALDGAEGPVTGPFYSYKKRVLSDTDSEEATTLDVASQSADDTPTPYIIAYHAGVQKVMDSRGLPWGVQWEIARLVSLGYCTWKDITPSVLDRLKNDGLSPSPSDSPGPARVLNSRIAPDLEDSFRRKKQSSEVHRASREAQATSPWQELDREDAAFRQYGPNACLGFTPELKSWYGGKVTFTMRLQTTKDGAFHFHLEHPVLGPSSRFTRTYGSAWLVRVRIPKENFLKPELSDKLKTFLVRPFILNGQVYRFFYANKDHNAYLMATNETYSGTSLVLDRQNRRFVSFLDFYSIHNNLSSNSHQARSALPHGRGSHFIFRQ